MPKPKEKTKPKTVDVVITRATVLEGGTIARPGPEVHTLPEPFAKNLLDRGRAELATEDAIAAAEGGDEGDGASDDKKPAKGKAQKAE